MKIHIHIDVPDWSFAMHGEGLARAWRMMGHEVTVRCGPPTDGEEPDIALVSFVQLLRADPERYYDLGERVHVGFRSHWELRSLTGDERLVLDKVGGIWACNRLLAEQATAKLGRRVDYRHDGVPTDIYYPRGIKAEPVHPFTVGWSGNASLVEKQWHVAARVGRAVDEMGGRFVACGRGLPLWPCLPLQEMPGWFRGLSAYICTSSEDGGPNGPLEAAACGVPTVSFRCGAMTDFIISGTTGLLVDDEQEMVSALETLRSEYKAADGMSWTMRRDARLRAEEWSLDNWARYFLADVLT